MSTLRWSILGTARIARISMIPAMHVAAKTEPLTIASERGKADNVVRKLDLPRAPDSFLALLEGPEVEAVYIPLPNSLHTERTITAARHGQHVLWEKPAALGLDEAQRMQQACDAAGPSPPAAMMAGPCP